MQDVDEWLIADDPTFNMNGNEILQSVFHEFHNIPPLNEIEELEEKNSFDTGHVVLLTSLSCFKPGLHLSVFTENRRERIANMISVNGCLRVFSIVGNTFSRSREKAVF